MLTKHTFRPVGPLHHELVRGVWRFRQTVMFSSKVINNPFPGLRAFHPDECRLFFGREGPLDELLTRLERTRFLAVVGSSGSGKSSLIKAGLIPALRGGMMSRTGSGWRIAVMRPGDNPIGNLAAELVKRDVAPVVGEGLPPLEAEAVFEATLRSSSLGLLSVASEARLRAPEKLLLVVDQFEELICLRPARKNANVDEAAAFVKLLLKAALQHELPIYIVLTLRSDFLGDCTRFQGLPEAINDGQYLIPRLTRDELRLAMTGPVSVAGATMTEPLINRLLNDTYSHPDQLPVLQHALMRTWEHWQSHHREGEPIGLEHYQAIGTMADALTRHADEAFNELPDEYSRQIAERLFKTLCEPGPGDRQIRRPTRLDTLCKITGASRDRLIAVTDVFCADSRSFLTLSESSDPVVDLSHESLIRNWQRLREWVNEETRSISIYRQLVQAALRYRDGNTGLLLDPALQVALDWREQSQPNAAWAERFHPEFKTAMAYLDESRSAREERINAAAQQHHDQEEHDKQELEQTKLSLAQQIRAARRLRWLLVVLAAILLLALSAAGYFGFKLLTHLLGERVS